MNQGHAAASTVHDAAAQGIAGSPHPLPHADTIQRLFGSHNISNIQAHTDESATAGAHAMGANAFATGTHVAFASTPDLHTAAHEAAHVVQQRASVHLNDGIGEGSDPYERNADEVADRVVQGLPAHDLLPAPAQLGTATPQHGIQRQDGSREMTDEEVAEALRWAAEGDNENGQIGVETTMEVQRVCGVVQNGTYDAPTARAVFAKQQELKLYAHGKANSTFCHRTGIIFTNPITAASVADPDLQTVERTFPNGVTVAIYPNYGGYNEFKTQADQFAINQKSVGVVNGAVALEQACTITTLGDILEVVQSIHRGLLQKWSASQGGSPSEGTAATGGEPPAYTKVRNLALFSHGETDGMGLNSDNDFNGAGLHSNEAQGVNGINPPNVEAFVRGLSDAVVPDARVQLFGCSAGRGTDRTEFEEWGLQDQGDRAGADSLASTMAQEFGEDATVLAHTTVGHATTNYAARVFGQEAGGGTGGVPLFELMYPESYIQSELRRNFPDLGDEERTARHDSMRDEMWDHFRDSVHGHPDRYPIPMGHEIFINPDNARTLLHADWEANWIPDHLDEVQPD